MEQPAETEKPALPSAEPKPQRPQAAVQGITPGQPAPVPVEPAMASKPSILQKIFGWLKSKPEAPPEPVRVKPREARRPQREGLRRERDHRRGSREDSAIGQRRGQEGGRDQARGQQQRQGDNERRMQSKPASAQSPGRSADSSRAEIAGESRSRAPERADRPARAERPERPRPEGAAEQHGEGRGRRRRGRRERGSEGGEGEGPRVPRAEAGLEPASTPDRHAPASPAADSGVRGSELDSGWSEPARMEPVAPQRNTREQLPEVVGAAPAAEPAVAEAPAQAAMRERATEPDTVRVTVAPPMEIASDRSLADPATLAAQRETAPQDEEMRSYRAPKLTQGFELPPDLIQVETSPEKVGQIPDKQVSPMGERLGERPRRPKQPEEPVPSEPLVQVETRH
jgi:ribonuclease E